MGFDFSEPLARPPSWLTFNDGSETKIEMETPPHQPSKVPSSVPFVFPLQGCPRVAGGLGLYICPAMGHWMPPGWEGGVRYALISPKRARAGPHGPLLSRCGRPPLGLPGIHVRLSHHWLALGLELTSEHTPTGWIPDSTAQWRHTLPEASG